MRFVSSTLLSIGIKFTYNDLKGVFMFTFNLSVIGQVSNHLEGLNAQKDEYCLKVSINTKNSFPFRPPGIQFSCYLEDNLFDINKLNFEEIMQENWHPSLRILDIIERLESFITPLISRALEKPAITCPTLTLFKHVTSSITVKSLIILSAIFIRFICYVLYSQEGFLSHYNTIAHTMNHPIVEWYTHDTEHEFQYYPPLYGYVYYLIGLFQSIVLEKHQEIGSEAATGSTTTQWDCICIMVLTLLEAFTLYSGMYMCIKSFYRKLTNRVKHAIIFLVLLSPVYLITNVIAIRFNSIMLGLMIWALYFCINQKAELCLFCTTLAVHMEPKALIFAISMIIYTMKAHVIDSGFADRYINTNNFQSLLNDFTDKAYGMVGSYLIFFTITGLIWLPWILEEDLTGMVNVITKVFLPENDLVKFSLKLIWFLPIFGYNLRALVMRPSKKIILLTLFNLAVGYSVAFTMNTDSISLIVTCGMMAFYELKEIIYLVIISCTYCAYPLSPHLSLLIYAVAYCILLKIFLNNLFKMASQEPGEYSKVVRLVDKNQDKNLDDKLCTGSESFEAHKAIPSKYPVINKIFNFSYIASRIFKERILRFLKDNLAIVESVISAILLVLVTLENIFSYYELHEEITYVLM